jgi:glucokinase
MKQSAIGIDIGGTNSKVGLVDETGKLLCFEKFPTDSQSGFEDFVRRMSTNINKLLTKHNISKTALSGVGIGAPNGNSQAGTIESPPNLAWDVVPIVKAFQQALEIDNIKLDNDANVAALGEGRWGVAKNSSNFIVVTLGTGIGTGIVANGELIRGSHGMAAEGGHLVIRPGGRPCNCGGMGHLECYASVRGIKTTTFIQLEKELSFHEISELYHAGDETMLQVVKKTANFLAIGLAQMGTIFAPDMFVLAGGVATLGEQFRSWTEQAYIENTYRPFKHISKLELSRISTAEGAVLGAASLVI